MTNNTCEYFNTDIAAHLLGISVSTIKRWRKSGDGPVYHRFGHSIKYTAKDLHEWAMSNRHRINKGFGM